MRFGPPLLPTYLQTIVQAYSTNRHQHNTDREEDEDDLREAGDLLKVACQTPTPLGKTTRSGVRQDESPAQMPAKQYKHASAEVCIAQVRAAGLTQTGSSTGLHAGRVCCVIFVSGWKNIFH